MKKNLACSASNNDMTRLVSPDCYKQNFTNKVRVPLSKGMSDAFTNSSKGNKQGLGCLRKIADTFGVSNDTTTSTISSDVDSAVTNLIPLNQALSSFVSSILNVLNPRRKFLLTTANIMNSSVSQYDSEGYPTGFVFSASEQTTIVNAFKVYANFLYSFFSGLNTQVSNIQGMIGKLDACRPPSAKRLLQAPTGNLFKLFICYKEIFSFFKNMHVVLNKGRIKKLLKTLINYMIE